MATSEEQHYQDLTNEKIWQSKFQHESAMNALIEAETLNKVAILKPKIFIDGNQWCVLYGENLQDGVCGFGSTIMQAIIDFNKAFDKPLS